MKKIKFCLLAVLAFSSFHAQIIDYTKGLNIWFEKPNSLAGEAIWSRASGVGVNPDPEWENASLPLGNGFLGANIMGSITKERITLNEKSLWKGGPNTAKDAAYYWDVNKESYPLLPQIRQAFLDHDLKKATALTEKNFNGLAAYTEEGETPFRFGSFTTMGELLIETGLSSFEITDYKRLLSLDQAVAEVSFKEKGTTYKRTSFISFPDQVMVIKFSSDKKNQQNLTLSYNENPDTIGKISSVGKDQILYVGKLKNNNMKFALRIMALPKNGNVKVENGSIIIDHADEAIFLITAATDYKMNFEPDFQDPKAYVGQDPIEITQKRLQQASTKSYDELFKNHIKDYTSLFNRVKLTLNQQVQNSKPTPQRLADYRKNGDDKGLESLYFQYGRYLLIASSRMGSMPANLQGVWLNNTDGPWRADYHNNINVQMNYWPALSGNLQETMPPLVDYIKTLVKPGEKTAKAYFNARGWTASISANIFGFTAPLKDQDMTWNFNPMAGPWLATHLWEYYDFTRDRQFLRETAYPLLKSSANFTVDYLWKRPDGYYSATPSTSPEHGPVDEGATFAHAVAREILMDAIRASKVLDTDINQRKEWENVLEKIIPYKIGRYGQLQEWYTDIDDPKDQHRHVNHLFGLQPGHSISPITTPDLAQASRVVLEHRGDGATGWSMGWKLNLWARLLDGNHAYLLFQNLLKNGTLDNLWDTHPPFQIDGNFGGTAGIIEMLLQSQMGFIHLLPALPDQWREGSVEGLMARGNFEVSINWKDHQLVSATVFSKSGGECTVLYRSAKLSWPTQKGKRYLITMVDDQLVQKEL